MRSILIIFICVGVLSCSQSKKQLNVEVTNLNGLIVKIIGKDISIHYKSEKIFNRDLSKKLHINYNSKKELLFINDSCYSTNIYEASLLSDYKTSSSNLIVQFEKYNDSLLIINNYILSEINICGAMESEEYPGTDSIDNSGCVLYSIFKPKMYNSNIYNISTGQKSFTQNIAKINVVEDILVVYELEKLSNSPWGAEYIFNQDIYKFDSLKFNRVYSINSNDSINRKHGYTNMSKFSNNIDSIKFFSDELFFLYQNSQIKIYTHEPTIKPLYEITSLPFDTLYLRDIDYINSISFYEHAFISYKQHRKYLNFVDNGIIKSQIFDSLLVNNYIVRGKEQYSDYEMIVFSIDSTNHFICQNSYFGNKLPELMQTINPLDSINSKFGILDTLPINSLSF